MDDFEERYEGEDYNNWEEQQVFLDNEGGRDEYVEPLVFTPAEIETIKWLAELVKSQALSERNAADRLYNAYNDRSFVNYNLAAARTKIARCDIILDRIREADHDHVA